MEGKRFIHRLKLKNLLSFGPEGVDIELEPLNVLIGPNASGKSNFIEAISLLQAAPTNIAKPISDGGGISEWLWKGPGALPTMEVEAAVRPSLRPPQDRRLLNHRIALGGRHSSTGWRVRRGEEAIERRARQGGATRAPVYRSGKADPPAMPEDQSILSQLRDPRNHPEITYLGREYARIQLYREWAVGGLAAPRAFQPADLPADAVLPDATNLALVLNALDNMPEHGKPVFDELRRFHPRAQRWSFSVMGGMIQVSLYEEGLETPVRATRLSDGTLHYLFLLAILHQPNPPPLVCIEEPELGLHPDIIPRVAELLVEASSRMQLIVTTHSDILVSALSQTPEAIVVCERDEAGTHLQRLEAGPLKEWIERYALGEAWLEGQIGGTVR